MPKFLVYGDEPYLIDEYRKKITMQVESPEFNLIDTNEFTEIEKQFLCQYPILGNKKVMIFRARTLKECTEVVEYISKKGKAAITYLFVKEVDRRSKIYRAFKKEEIQVYKKVPQDVLEKTIMQYIKKSGCEVTTDAYRLYLQMINYYSDETNLYDVLHSLERLCVVKRITKETVENIVLDREKEDIYSLIQLIVGKQYDDMFRQADLILRNQQNNVIGILSLLLRSYRLAYKIQACNTTLKDLGIAYRTFIPRLPADICNQSMNILDDAINKVKRGFYNQEVALKITLAKLCYLQKET